MNSPSGECKRIALWSGPRNISTALMYSFAQRPDTKVVDEPLFGYFLKETGAARPSREEVLATMETDAEKIINDQLLGPCDAKVYFMKHIANHLIGLDWEFILNFRNIILIRDPREMLISYRKQIARPTILDTAYKIQVELMHFLQEKEQEVIILDARDILEQPEPMLKALCNKLDITFHPEMLSWPAGPRPEDGIWAKYWYHTLHKSTGFQIYRNKTQALPGDLMMLYESCRRFYRKLNQHKLQP